jgi:hypothetical protein
MTSSWWTIDRRESKLIKLWRLWWAGVSQRIRRYSLISLKLLLKEAVRYWMNKGNYWLMSSVRMLNLFWEDIPLLTTKHGRRQLMFPSLRRRRITKTLSMITLATKEVNCMSIDKTWRVYLSRRERRLAKRIKRKARVSYCIQRMRTSLRNDYLTMLSYKI